VSCIDRHLHLSCDVIISRISRISCLRHLIWPCVVYILRVQSPWAENCLGSWLDYMLLEFKMDNLNNNGAATNLWSLIFWIQSNQIFELLILTNVCYVLIILVTVDSTSCMQFK
jgi:hypothetical protein